MRDRAATERPQVHLVQHAGNIRMRRNGGVLALNPLLRVGAGNRCCAGSMRDTLQGNRKPGVVHHREHRRQAFALPADEFAFGTLENQVAGG